MDFFRTIQKLAINTVVSSATSTARSLVTAKFKKQANSFFTKEKSMQDIEDEIVDSLGYSTEYYKLDKKQNITYKSSELFVHEWLTKNPDLTNRIMRDEESGTVYFDGEQMNNTIKVKLLTILQKNTGVQSAALSRHFDAALKLIDVSDFTASKFKETFKGWNASDPSVINTWMQGCFGDALDNPEYATFLFKKWIVGTANRAMKPGTVHDGCLTLKGPSGVGKTTFFRGLLPKPFDTRTGEIYCNIKSPQKFLESITGKTIACFDELSVLDYPSTQELFKQLLSSVSVDTRLPWRRDPQRYLLRQGFGATTNKSKFISDEFISRRLWTVSLNDKSRLDFDFVNKNKKKLWMEAVYLVNSGETSIMNSTNQEMIENYNNEYML
jgi:hypothetical protein